MTTTDVGRDAERRAEQFLKAKGFKLITRNFHAKTGEIDLVMASQDTLVFVEVRLRNNQRYGSGADSVTPAKQRKLINTAHLFLQGIQSPRWRYFRFDVISIGRDIDWIPNAFTLD